MPVSTEEELAGIDALDIVCESLNSPTFEKNVKAKDADINFLSSVMNSNILQSLVQAFDSLEDTEMAPVSCDNIELLSDLVDELNIKGRQNAYAQELKALLCSPHFQALIEAHDDIAAKNYDPLLDNMPVFPAPMDTSAPPPDQSNAIRMVGIRKKGDEPLGITVKTDQVGNLEIARILAGSSVDQQGLLHVGDIIKEINGQEVKSPDQMNQLIRKCTGTITLKIIPSYWDQGSSSQVFLKAHFNYDPKKDQLIPSRDTGLAFKEGEILHVLNMDDPNWWQACKVEDTSVTGLIPSQTLEEKRKAFVRPEYDYTHKSLLCGLMTKKKKKLMYQVNNNAEYDRNDLLIYQEVARMPPFTRKTLVLIGAQGVGRRTLKQRFIKADPTRFGGVIPYTSRPMRQSEKDGESYWFIQRDIMEADIAKGRYLEYGEHDGNLYGIKFDSVRQVIKKEKMCILDLNPTALKVISTAEFQPYVVFIAAPPIQIMRNMHEYARMRNKTDKFKTERDFRNTLDESQRIERQYKSQVNMTIVNDNIDETYSKLRRAIETFSTQPQWIPMSWVY